MTKTFDSVANVFAEWLASKPCCVVHTLLPCEQPSVNALLHLLLAMSPKIPPVTSAAAPTPTPIIPTGFCQFDVGSPTGGASSTGALSSAGISTVTDPFGSTCTDCVHVLCAGADASICTVPGSTA